MSRVKSVWLPVCLALLVCQGCGASAEAKLRNDLKLVGLAYVSYYDENKKGPTSWDELIAFAGKSNLEPDAVKRVRDAGYVMDWSADLNNAPAGASNTVLGKPPGAGPTLYLDGAVK